MFNLDLAEVSWADIAGPAGRAAAAGAGVTLIVPSPCPTEEEILRAKLAATEQALAEQRALNAAYMQAVATRAAADEMEDAYERRFGAARPAASQPVNVPATPEPPSHPVNAAIARSTKANEGFPPRTPGMTW